MPSGLATKGYRIKMENNPRPAIIRPTTIDIAWAAGIFEGEGSFSGSGMQCAVAQKDLWLLEKMRDLFGSRIYRHPANINRWYASGARARGFILTIFKFLSPRRKEQALAWLRSSAGWPK